MSKPRMLSSQPKRSWGDSHISDDEPENTRPDFTLNSDEWPPTPPKKRPVTVAGAKGKQVAGARQSSVGGGLGGARTAMGGQAQAQAQAQGRPLTSTSVQKPAFVKESPGGSKVPLAPLFRRAPSASTSSSSSSSSRPGPSTYAYNNPTTGSVLPKKRTLPWEELEASSSRSTTTSSSSRNFHELAGPPGSKNATGGAGRLLMSESMDIKQKVVLSPEQQTVHKLVVEDGKNVFFTGSAGTGKSVLLREIISSLKRKYKSNADAVAVTASTGMAACNIGGQTIHSFASIGIGTGSVEQLVANVKKNRNANAKWQRVKVLVVDEVSMVDGILFDKLAKIAESLKKNPRSKTAASKPFGGIQLVVTGDFFQLPPVTKGSSPTFAFEAQAWKECIHHTVNLTQVFRQKDTEFIDMLNEMRFGKLRKSSIDKFYALKRELKYSEIEPTELFPMRHDVDRANTNRLRSLAGESRLFRAEDSEPDPSKQGQWFKNIMAPDVLELKIGAQVMLIKNLDQNLVNGTVGHVVGFGVPELADEEEEEEGGREGWTLNSRDEPVRVKGEMSVTEARKRQKIAEGVASGRIEQGPVVAWQTPNGIEKKVMVREEFKHEDNNGQNAWAMSIHKSQGQTIQRVKVDLGKVFEKGQSYVALSRATSLEGLQVLRFDPKKVLAHEKVIQWSRSLEVLS
uniref:ATP-dependent DNA helicase PIF1 n=1 Tax=Rhodotorula toruloides TaxID=5286 RepID=A0A0K3C6U0_RHOTO